MEPLRPPVDRLLLDLLPKTIFAFGDFIRGDDGACRLHPQFAGNTVATCRLADAIVVRMFYLGYP
jgi:hypothetical protein